MYSLREIADITGAELRGPEELNVTSFLTDSRALRPAAGTLFIAIKTLTNDGHRYIESLIREGLRSFLVLKEFDTAPHLGSGASFLVVEDTLRALQLLAAVHRKRFSIPVIGITGSNGKTVVKEWLYQLLKYEHVICRSPKSYNSQIGVALSVLTLRPEHTLAIFEAGISQRGEMERLERMIRPTLGILTSFGSAHSEGFKGNEEKLAEKLRLFASCGIVIMNGIERKSAVNINGKKIIISESPDADVVTSIEDGSLQLKLNNERHEYSLPFTDRASLMNAATCAVTLLQLNYADEMIGKRLGELQPVALRLETRKGLYNSVIISDYYNSDLDSLEIALDFLRQQSRKMKKILVLSDIEQSGMQGTALYKRVATLIKSHDIDLLIGVGKEITAHKELFERKSLYFSDTREFTKQLAAHSEELHNATILLKGARSFGFESIDRLLQLKSHDTVFEINLEKLTANINYFRGLTGPGVKLMCMVKAMGYGSGSAEIASTLQHIGVDYLAVAYADEGVELRDASIHLPIMVMNPESGAVEDIITRQLEPEIYSFRVLDEFIAALDKLGVSEPYPIHIKIDTGMHRLGFEEKDLAELTVKLKGLPQVKVISVFSHLAAADNPALDKFTVQQLSAFENAFRLLEKELGYRVLIHICNTAGIMRFPEAHYDMVRLGIGMYGISGEVKDQAQLQNAGALKTRISQIKQLDKGQTVGYNRSGKVQVPTKIATIPIGYADGFSRQLGNGKHGVYIAGKFCKTVGGICMDMCMVDVTGINCKEGDEVIIFESAVQVQEMAIAMNSISYEVLTNVSGRVKRVYMQE